MSISSVISGWFKPAVDLVDELHTSEEERLTIKATMTKLENQVTAKVVDYEAQLLEAKSNIIIAEAQGQSWMQRNWRPITMLTFLVLIVMDTMGWTHFRLSEQAWTVLQYGLGGYVVGRTVEKTVPHLKDAFKKGKDTL
ncbi:3TM-type holin [Vibrio mediterranei]